MSSSPVNSPDIKLEVILFGVADADRAKAFYENLGWRIDIDVAEGDFRIVQITPPNSEASIVFGKGVTSCSFQITPRVAACSKYYDRQVSELLLQ
jgi:catechol 2,3-dioxygenase-like lactoylglutathione lyase family enzyme